MSRIWREREDTDPVRSRVEWRAVAGWRCGCRGAWNAEVRMAGVVDDDARNEMAMDEIFIVFEDVLEQESFQRERPIDDRDRVVVCVIPCKDLITI